MASYPNNANQNLLPPYSLNHKNQARLVGFEIEYVGPTIEQTCQLLKNLYSGKIKRLNDNEYHVLDTKLGSFKVELDARLLKEMASQAEDNSKKNKVLNIEGYLHNIISTVMKNVIPLEIITPPVPIANITLLDDIIVALHKSHARGTHSSKIAAFGVHLNPDLPNLSAQCILSYIQSYVLLSDWLRQEIDVDVSRVLSRYITEYPMRYRKKILKSTYQPTLNILMDDYLHYNATRNRALDLLTLFAFIDEERVTRQVKSKLIKPRPTFHYRLANSNLNHPSWNLTTEWKRWLLIEYLAFDDVLRNSMAETFLNQQENKTILSGDKQWVSISERYVKTIRENNDL